MKKKNLIILLLIPFLISLLGIITMNITINTFYGDITSIEWKYSDVEAFEIGENKKYKLEATPYNASNAPLDSGNSLIWRCDNVDLSIEDKIAEIEKIEEDYYLKPLKTGEITITCSNFKGNIFRKMNAIIYKDGVVIITPEISSSQNNIDLNVYYGEYDLVNNKKENATFNFNVKCIPSELSKSLLLSSHSDNIVVNLTNKKVTIMGSGDAYFSLSSNGVDPSTYKFKVVDEGINVYSYNDLLKCTNLSEEGEIVVLRKSFESKLYINNDNNNVVSFGNKKSDGTFDFNNDVYRFETTFNQEYIKGWNNFATNNGGYSTLSNKLVAGLRVQKDFYGNGYTINMHNLTYPTDVQKQNSIEVPFLNDRDLFRGPLPFYTLGDPNNNNHLVTAYGQDNVGMYIDGDNITVNDVNLKNTEIKGSLSFLDTVGTVVDVHGNNNTIKNSRLSNGKNVLRCFSTQNFTLSNSLLSNSRNFLLEVGSNEYMSYDEAKEYEFTSFNGSKSSMNINEYLNTKEANGDIDLINYMLGSFEDSKMMRSSLLSIQNALNDRSKVENQYKGSITIKDTYFYNSGIASIAMESLFNGPFLYQPVPTTIAEMLSSMSYESKPIIPFSPTKVGGISYPIQVDLVGDTKFFDYKNSSNIDITGIISENISEIAKMLLGEEKNITIDTVFPIKPLILSKARSLKSTYSSEGIEYINIPIAYYGGGLNLSKINIDNLNMKDQLCDTFDVDFLDSYLTPSSGELGAESIKDIVLRCVTIVTGFDPFKFVCVKGNELYGKNPDVQDLIKNAKGE